MVKTLIVTLIMTSMLLMMIVIRITPIPYDSE